MEETLHTYKTPLYVELYVICTNKSKSENNPVLHWWYLDQLLDAVAKELDILKVLINGP